MTDLTSSGSIIRVSRELVRLFEGAERAADLVREGDRQFMRGKRTQDLQNITREAIASRIWRHEGRQVLFMHPAVVDEVKVANSDRISGRVLQTLPFMSPMVAYADPPMFKTWIDGDTGALKDENALRLLGFVTFAHSPLHADESWRDAAAKLQYDALNVGGKMKLQLTPTNPMYDLFEPVTFNTHDPRAMDFGVAALFEVVDKLDRVIDWQISLVSIPLYAETTFKQTVDDLIERFDFAVGRQGDDVNAQGKKWMREVMSIIVGSLFYLCSTTLETEDMQKLPRKQAQKIVNPGRKAPSVYRVGWKMGAALTALRNTPVSDDSEGGLPGCEQTPQHRRGHFKMQPYGPQNSLRKLIYVSPYWTQLEKLHLYDIKTVRRVPRVGPPGSARDAMRSTLGVSAAMQETDF